MGAAFPQAIKVFSVFHDYTDTIMALSINECHDEIQALEKTLGTNPFNTTPYTTFGGAIQDLYANKSPANHFHYHRNLSGDASGNDHPQYIMVNGYPGFSRPVSGHAGTAPSDLVPLSQLQGFGFQNAAQVRAMVDAAVNGDIAAATAGVMAGTKGGTPLLGSTTSVDWRITGGLTSGCTLNNGVFVIPFGTSFSCIQAFSCTKIPPQGSGCPPYNWIEAQVTLLSVSQTQALVQVSHDYSWQPNMRFSCTWIVMGI